MQRLLLAILVISSALVGFWAQLFPRSFYDDFPGAGRHWVAMDGPFNEHLVRDVGALNLALGVLTLVAFITLTRLLVRVVAVAWLVYGIPHVAYHVGHLSMFDTVDQIGIVVSLGGMVLVALVLLVVSFRPTGVARGAAPSAEPSAVG